MRAAAPEGRSTAGVPRRRPDTARTLGTVGALLIAIGALGAGALPVPNPLAGLRLVGLPARTTTLSLALAWAGAALVVLAWLQVGRRVRAGGPDAPSLAALGRAAALWTLPVALAPPVFSRDVYSYLAQGATLARGLSCPAGLLRSYLWPALPK
jgi:alpha-1,6-mannosyltransferase